MVDIVSLQALVDISGGYLWIGLVFNAKSVESTSMESQIFVPIRGRWKHRMLQFLWVRGIVILRSALKNLATLQRCFWESSSRISWALGKALLPREYPSLAIRNHTVLLKEKQYSPLGFPYVGLPALMAQLKSFKCKYDPREVSDPFDTSKQASLTSYSIDHYFPSHQPNDTASVQTPWISVQSHCR